MEIKVSGMSEKLLLLSNMNFWALSFLLFKRSWSAFLLRLAGSAPALKCLSFFILCSCSSCKLYGSLFSLFVCFGPWFAPSKYVLLSAFATFVQTRVFAHMVLLLCLDTQYFEIAYDSFVRHDGLSSLAKNSPGQRSLFVIGVWFHFWVLPGAIWQLAAQAAVSSSDLNQRLLLDLVIISRLLFSHEAEKRGGGCTYGFLMLDFRLSSNTIKDASEILGERICYWPQAVVFERLLNFLIAQKPGVQTQLQQGTAERVSSYDRKLTELSICS